MSRLLIVLGFVSAALLCAAAASAGPKKTPPKVFCPAVSEDDHSERLSNVPTGIRPVALIVVGTLDPETRKLQVDRTLLGPEVAELSVPKIQTDYLKQIPDTPRIYCLSLSRREWRANPARPDIRSLEWTEEYRFEISEHFEPYRVFELSQEPEIAVLARARLDLLVLSSPLIFVGRPIPVPPPPPPHPVDAASPKEDPGRPAPKLASDDPPPVPVQVERVLYGSGPAPAPAPGQTVLVQGPFDPLPSADGSYVYFAAPPTPVPAAKPQRSRVPVPLSIVRRWPAAVSPLVEATLARRPLFPVRDQHQEIVFLGTTAEAIALLGSDFDAAQTLGARRLITSGDAAVPEVARFVENQLFEEMSIEGRDPEHQRRVIEALGLLERERPVGETTRLVNHMLDRIQAGEPFPDSGKRSELPERRKERGYGYLPADANHSLLWLLSTFDPPVAARLFGERLLQLRALTAYGWREEIQDFLDRSHLEDHLQLIELRTQLASVEPLRWSAAATDQASPKGHARPITQLEFSPDGTRLRTVSDEAAYEWDVRTGEALGPAPASPAEEDAQPSPDVSPSGGKWSGKGGGRSFFGDRFLGEDGTQWYRFQFRHANGPYGRPVACALEVGRIERASTADTHSRERPRGKILGEVDLQWGQHEPYGLVPDGLHFYIATQIFRRDDLHLVSAANVSGTIESVQFSADGASYGLVTSQRERRPGPLAGVTSTVEHTRLRVHDTASGRTRLIVELPGEMSYRMAVSPDGRLLAVVDARNRIQLWPVAAK